MTTTECKLKCSMEEKIDNILNKIDLHGEKLENMSKLINWSDGLIVKQDKLLTRIEALEKINQEHKEFNGKLVWYGLGILASSPVITIILHFLHFI